jgi:hypothetical protein
MVHPMTGNIYAGADDGTVKVWKSWVPADMFSADKLAKIADSSINIQRSSSKLKGSLTEKDVEVLKKRFQVNNMRELVDKMSSGNTREFMKAIEHDKEMYFLLKKVEDDSKAGLLPSEEDEIEVSEVSEKLRFVLSLARVDTDDEYVPNSHVVEPDFTIPANMHEKHHNEISCMKLSNDGAVLYTGSLDGKVKGWSNPSLTPNSSLVKGRGGAGSRDVITDKKFHDEVSVKPCKQLFEIQVGSPVLSLALSSEVVLPDDSEDPRCSKDKLYAGAEDDVVTVWDCQSEETTQFRNKGEYRSVAIEELITPILDIGTLTMQMLGFPFGEDMPWSEEVEPVQYTLPIFQMEFRVTPALFVFQFWCVSCFCIVFCILCLGDVHENLMDRIAGCMVDSTYEELEEDEHDIAKKFLEEDNNGASASEATEAEKQWQGAAISKDAESAYNRVRQWQNDKANVGAPTESLITVVKLYFGEQPADYLNSPEILTSVKFFAFLRDYGALSNAITFQTILAVFQNVNFRSVDRCYEKNNGASETPPPATRDLQLELLPVAKIVYLCTLLRQMSLEPFVEFKDPFMMIDEYVLKIDAVRVQDKMSSAEHVQPLLKKAHANLSVFDFDKTKADKSGPWMQLQELEVIKNRLLKNGYDRFKSRLTAADCEKMRTDFVLAMIRILKIDKLKYDEVSVEMRKLQANLDDVESKLDMAKADISGAEKEEITAEKFFGDQEKGLQKTLDDAKKAHKLAKEQSDKLAGQIRPKITSLQKSARELNQRGATEQAKATEEAISNLRSDISNKETEVRKLEKVVSTADQEIQKARRMYQKEVESLNARVTKTKKDVTSLEGKAKSDRGKAEAYNQKELKGLEDKIKKESNYIRMFALQFAARGAVPIRASEFFESPAALKNRIRSDFDSSFGEKGFVLFKGPEELDQFCEDHEKSFPMLLYFVDIWAYHRTTKNTRGLENLCVPLKVPSLGSGPIDEMPRKATILIANGQKYNGVIEARNLHGFPFDCAADKISFLNVDCSLKDRDLMTMKAVAEAKESVLKYADFELAAVKTFQYRYLSGPEPDSRLQDSFVDAKNDALTGGDEPLSEFLKTILWANEENKMKDSAPSKAMLPDSGWYRLLYTGDDKRVLSKTYDTITDILGLRRDPLFTKHPSLKEDALAEILTSIEALQKPKAQFEEQIAFCASITGKVKTASVNPNATEGYALALSALETTNTGFKSSWLRYVSCELAMSEKCLNPQENKSPKGASKAEQVEQKDRHARDRFEFFEKQRKLLKNPTPSRNAGNDGSNFSGLQHAQTITGYSAAKSELLASLRNYVHLPYTPAPIDGAESDDNDKSTYPHNVNWQATYIKDVFYRYGKKRTKSMAVAEKCSFVGPGEKAVRIAREVSGDFVTINTHDFLR